MNAFKKYAKRNKGGMMRKFIVILMFVCFFASFEVQARKPICSTEQNNAIFVKQGWLSEEAGNFYGMKKPHWSYVAINVPGANFITGGSVDLLKERAHDCERKYREWVEDAAPEGK